MPVMIRALAISLILAVTLVPLAFAQPRDVTIAQGIDAEFLDVQMTNNIVTLIINTSIYDTLLTRNKQLDLVPSLATSYRNVSEKVWEVKLRPNVQFHNGEPFDANAVKFSFERIYRADFKSPQKGWFNTIDRVEIVDPLTVRFHTKVPDPAMPARMTLMYQLAPKYVTQVGDQQANLKPVGTGPFKFVEWQKNERIVVEANDAHWSGKPAVRKATWRPIPELGARMAALQTGQADIIVNVPPDQLQALQTQKNVRIEKTPSCRIISFAIAQIKGGPLADKRVRQALNHAVDMQAILDAVLLGNGKRLNSWMPPNVWGYDSSIPFYDYNPKKAKELLAAAGQPNLTLTIQAPNGRWAMDKDIAQAVAGQLTENGIKTNVKVIGEWGAYVRTILDHKTEDMAMSGWCLPSLDPDHWVTPNLRTGEPVSQYSNPEIDKLMEQARAEINTDKRKQLYSNLLRAIRDDAPYIFGYQQMDIYGVNNRIKWTPRGDESIRLTEISF
ncbi:MAG TPA: ABC transporter substrate-binding protein [Methylomirabilota bacterium]|jgi:peptide/nickel transport system substrate-binding protein